MVGSYFFPFRPHPRGGPRAAAVLGPQPPRQRRADHRSRGTGLPTTPPGETGLSMALGVDFSHSFEPSFVSKSGRYLFFPRVSGGSLERRIPGKNGNGRYPLHGWSLVRCSPRRKRHEEKVGRLREVPAPMILSEAILRRVSRHLRRLHFDITETVFVHSERCQLEVRGRCRHPAPELEPDPSKQPHQDETRVLPSGCFWRCFKGG